MRFFRALLALPFVASVFAAPVKTVDERALGDSATQVVQQIEAAVKNLESQILITALTTEAQVTSAVNTIESTLTGLAQGIASTLSGVSGSVGAGVSGSVGAGVTGSGSVGGSVGVNATAVAEALEALIAEINAILTAANSEIDATALQALNNAFVYLNTVLNIVDGIYVGVISTLTGLIAEAELVLAPVIATVVSTLGGLVGSLSAVLSGVLSGGVGVGVGATATATATAGAQATGGVGLGGLLGGLGL